ncbi:MAG: hypothetical protein VX641_06845 [Planctomycetota bacterium]|nr:hypothetical protein [Planctomycetota bacterium]
MFLPNPRPFARCAAPVLVLMFSTIASAQTQATRSSMPPLPQPSDFVGAPTSRLSSDTPKQMGMFGTEIGQYEIEGRTYLLVGQSRGISVFTRDEEGVLKQVQFISPPERCTNPGTFGTSFSLDGDRLFVRPTVIDASAAVHVYRREGMKWTPHQDITVSDIPTEGATLGRKVSSGEGVLAIHGRGDVHLFTRGSDGRHAFSQTLSGKGDSEFEKTRFGKSFAISGDTLVISSFRAPRLNECIDVFQRSPNGIWSHRQRISPPHREFGVWFGHALALEGDTLVASSPRWKNSRGSVDVFKVDASGDWVHSQSLGVFPDSLSSFGTGLRLEGDVLLVLASMPKVPGSAYLFRRGGEGLFKRDSMFGLASAEESRSGFGASGSISTCGERIMVGAPLSSSDGTGRAGAVLMYANPTEVSGEN